MLLTNLTPLLSEGILLNARTYFDARLGTIRTDPAVDVIDELGDEPGDESR